MSFQWEYAERYDWMKQQFIDWAFTLYQQFTFIMRIDDTLNDETRQMMQQSMAAFGGIAPTYHIALDKPTIIWDFHSLMLGVQMMFSFMLTDSETD